VHQINVDYTLSEHVVAPSGHISLLRKSQLPQFYVYTAQNSTHSGTAIAVDVHIMETYGGVKVYVHLFLALVLD